MCCLQTSTVSRETHTFVKACRYHTAFLHQSSRSQLAILSALGAYQISASVKTRHIRDRRVLRHGITVAHQLNRSERMKKFIDWA